jgi:hypothetical protein
MEMVQAAWGLRTGAVMQVSVSRKLVAFAPMTAMEVRLTASCPVLVRVMARGPA